MVHFLSPKRSARTLQVAAEHARAVGAEIIVLKVVPDAHKVGVVAELIATDRPTQKATEQVARAAHDLDAQGIAARGVVRVDQVTEGIIRSAIEWHADAVYVGTFQHQETMRLQQDPIARYLVDHCPANVVLVRQLDPGDDRLPPLPSLPKPAFGQIKYKRVLLWFALIFFLMMFAMRCGNTGEVLTGDSGLTSHTSLSLMDWHVSGLWVINSPVAWVRVTNYNNVPIKDIEFEYKTFTSDGKPLDTGTYEIEGSVPPHTSKNFIELYLGLVALESERLDVRLLSVKHG